MKSIVLVLLFLFEIDIAYAQIVNVQSVQSGDWHDPATWEGGVVPSESWHFVTIEPGHTVTVNADATCGQVTIAGTLEFESGDFDFITIYQGGVSVAVGGHMSSSPLAVASSMLFLEGSLTNEGEVNLNNADNTAGVNITATGSTDATISGTGTTNLREVTVNKTSGTDTSAAAKLTISTDNLTVQGSTGGAPPFITILNGELEVTGSDPFSSPFFISPGNTIGAGDVFTLDNPNVIITGQNGSMTIGNDGLLRVKQGTLNIGNSNNNSLVSSSGSTIIFEGGVVNVYGAFCPSFSSSSFTFEQTGGTLTVFGNHTSTSVASLDFGTSSFTNFTFTGGEQIIVNPSAAASGPRDYRGPSASATLNITAGGTLQFGDATTTAPATFNVQGVLPNFDFDPTVDRIRLQNTTTTILPATVPNGITFELNGRTFNVQQDLTIDAGGELDGNTASSVLGFTGSSVQTFTNNGTITNGYIKGLTINNSSASSPSVSLNSNVEVTNTLTLSDGILGGSGTLTIGNSTVSNNMTVTRSGGGILNTPTFNLTGVTYNVTYTAPSPAVSITTSNELPSTISGTLTINNSSGVILNGSAGVDVLNLTSGNLTTTNTNILTVTGGSGSDVVRISGYVDGPMQITLPASTTSGEFLLPVGKGGLYLGTALVNPNTNSGGPVIVIAEAFTGNSGGTPGTGMSSIETDKWNQISITSGEVDFIDALIRIYGSEVRPVSGGSLVGKSETPDGVYNSIGGDIVGSYLTSTIPVGSFSYFSLGTTSQTVSGTKTVGASGADYSTLTEAIDDVTSSVFTGPVVLSLLDASYPTETFPIIIPPISGASSTNTLMIKPASGVSPVISGNSSTAIVKLDGSDYVTIDGSNSGTSSRDMTIMNTLFSDGTAGIWLSSGGTGAGATNNTIKNCNISTGADQTTSNTFSYGIISSGTAITTSSDGTDNDNNLFQNNFITKARYGIFVRGISSNTNDFNTIASNIIGPASFGSDQIGKGGIVIQYQNLATVSNNEVRCVGSASGIPEAASEDRVGIGIGEDDWPLSSSTIITNSVITGNSVHDIVEEKTKSASGITIAGTGFPTNNVIANNMIHNVRSNGTSGDQGTGIGIAFGNGDKVVFNSILMEGDIDPGSSTTATGSNAGIRISSSFNAQNLTLKNNIVSVDMNSNTSGLNHYAIVVPSTTYSWGTGGLDYNNYYINGSNSQMKIGGTGTSVPYTAVSDFATWQTTLSPNRDANSQSFAPDFTSSVDLHLDVSSLDTDYIGTPIAGVTTDFDDEGRDVLFPYIGADEELGFPLPVEIVSFSVLPKSNSVELKWNTATEVNNYGFEVERKQIPLVPSGHSPFIKGETSEASGGFLKIGFAKGNGTSNSPKEYSFTDSKLKAGRYSYRLKQIDADGKFVYSQTVEVEIAAPKEFALYQNFPNPFNPATEIRYQISEVSHVALKVYDMLGREVATLVNEMREPGNYEMIFNASSLSSGVYFYILKADNFVSSKKMILIK